MYRRLHILISVESVDTFEENELFPFQDIHDFVRMTKWYMLYMLVCELELDPPLLLDVKEEILAEVKFTY